MSKRRVKAKKIILSNRSKYALITLGILLIIIAGVYAYGTFSPATIGHTAKEFNFTGGFVIPSGDLNITAGKLCFGTNCKSNLTG